MSPSKKELFQRLKDRSISNLELVYTRMQEVLSDVIHYIEYDYVIVNDNFKHTVLEIKKIIQLERLNMQYKQKNYLYLIKELIES